MLSMIERRKSQVTKYFGLSNLEDGIIIEMVELSLREKKLQVWRVLFVCILFCGEKFNFGTSSQIPLTHHKHQCSCKKGWKIWRNCSQWLLPLGPSLRPWCLRNSETRSLSFSLFSLCPFTAKRSYLYL